MARLCQITGKKPLFGNRRSKAMNATRHVFKLNLHNHRYWLPSEQRFIKLKLTSHAMKIINKRGIEEVLRELGANALKG